MNEDIIIGHVFVPVAQAACIGDKYASRNLSSSSADKNRRRAFFSGRCSTSRAGLLDTLPSAHASHSE